MSCVTIQWAAYAIANGARTQSYLALAVTLLLGVAVVNQTIFYYLDMGLAIDDSRAALLMYVITGSHLAMLGAAMVFIVLMAIRALAGQYAGRQSDGIVAATIYWYAMVAVYFVIWIGIYIAK
jgi:heme/copper-type cytochrome/quinol oxidase subunit 3